MSNHNPKLKTAFTGPSLLVMLMLTLVAAQTMRHSGVLATAEDQGQLVCDERGVLAYRTDVREGRSGNQAPSCAPFFFEPVPINSASKELLTTIPGIGLKTAEKIQQEIVEHGYIRGPDGLMRVDGIGTAKMARMLPHVSFK